MRKNKIMCYSNMKKRILYIDCLCVLKSAREMCVKQTVGGLVGISRKSNASHSKGDRRITEAHVFGWTFGPL